MANPRYNTQVTQPRGSSARVGKMGGGMMRPMYKAGGRTKKMSEAQKQAAKKTGAKVGKFAKKVGKAALMLTPIGAAKAAGDAVRRIKKMGGGRIAGAARRAQEHGYYTPDMGMKGGRMYRDGGKVKKPKVKKIAIGIGKAKDYPGIKKIMEMNKKGKKRFKDGGSAMKPVDKSKNPGLAKLPTQVRNKMGYMKKGGRVHKNTSRMNRLEELGRVDAERGFTRKGKKNLKAEKKRIVRELKR
jgi:hypothetical protein